MLHVSGMFPILTIAIVLVGPSAYGNTLPPLFDFQKLSKVPMTERVLRDPEIVIPGSKDQAEDLVDKTKKIIEKMAEKKKKSSALLKKIYRNFVGLHYYSQDNPDFKSKFGKNEADEKGFEELYYDYASKYYALTKSKKGKVIASYHMYVREHLAELPPTQLVSLNKYSKFIPSPLRSRVTLIKAINQPLKNRRSSLNTISGLQNRFGLLGHVVTSLHTARILAGVDDRGVRRQKAAQKYLDFLQSANNLALQLPTDQRKQVFRFAVTLWTAVTGGKASDWIRFPLQVDTKIADLNYFAVSEQMALAKALKGDFGSAIRHYQLMPILEISRNGFKLPVMVDKRIWKLEMFRFRTSRTFEELEQFHLKMREKYSPSLEKSTQAPKELQSIAGYFAQTYETWIREILDDFLRNNYQEFAENIFTVTENFLDHNIITVSRREVSEKLARVYYKIGQKIKTVAIYKELAKKEKDKKKYILLAIATQHEIAKWPKKPVWKIFPESQRPERTHLLALYQALHAELQQKTDWFVRSNFGLLSFHLGQKQKAFDLWTIALRRLRAQPFTNHAAGFMLADLYKEKKWDQFITVAHIVLKKKVLPLVDNRPFGLELALANALYTGGLLKFQGKVYKKAALYLHEFQKRYQKDQRRGNALFYLANAYHLSANYSLATSTLVGLENQYPSHSNKRQALLLGFRWANDMSFEEQAIFFCERFLEIYPRDPVTPGVRKSLANLYRAKERYSLAAQLHKDHSQDMRVGATERLHSVLEVVDINYRYGDDTEVLWGIQKVMQVGKSVSHAYGPALAILSRLAFKNKNIQQLNQIESQINSSKIAKKPELREALGETRFYAAELQNQEPKDDIHLISLKKPKETIQSIYRQFLSHRNRYQLVCAGGVSSFCAPALSRLIAVSQNWRDVIEKIAIPDTLDKASVQQFEKFRIKYAGSMKQAEQKYQNRAVSLAREGTTTPPWALQILKNQEQAIGKPVKGQFVNGFVQWQSGGDRSSKNDDL